MPSFSRNCRMFSSLTLLVLAACTAHAQLIRPDSASTTSFFNSNYVAANTINGTGLPANFTLTDPHANYAQGNHWTTATGRTIGESITWTFNTAQALGGIHVWNHRSNGVAANPNYEPVRFDLVLFDGPNATGNTLRNFTNLTLLTDIAIAQAVPFTVTSNVRSARFIVRETQNNNSSPFTGLAEVAFAPCISVGSGTPVTSTSLCRTGTTALTAQPTGSGALNFQWQWRGLGETDWRTMVDVPNFGTGVEAVFDATGATAASVTFSLVAGSPRKEVRVLMSNPCGSTTSNVAFLDLQQCDCIDFNNNGVFPEDQDLIDFFETLAGGACG